MRDVAQAAGVSTMTVSNALTGRRPVHEATRRRVLSAVDRLGYQVNVAARSLREGRTGIVGVAVPTLDSPYFGLLGSLLVRRFSREGLRVVVEETGGGRQGEIAALHGSRSNAYDGLVLSSVGLEEGEVDALRGELPVVVLGEEPLHRRVDHVGMANVEAAGAATRLLLERGCRRLVFVGARRLDAAEPAGGDEPYAFRRRAHGVASVLRQHPDAVGDSVHRGTTLQDGVLAAYDVLDRGTALDGVVCATDTLAFGVMRGLADRGVRVPDDVLVVGFDDVTEARFSIPSLSTVAPGHEELVDRTAHLLLRRMDDRGAEPESWTAPFTVVERESTTR